MGSNESKSYRSSAHHHPTGESDDRREQVRRYLEEFPTQGDDLSFTGGQSVFYYPASHLGRSHSDHDLVYMDKSGRGKPKSKLTTKLSRWMRRLGSSKERRRDDPSRCASEIELPRGDRPALQMRHRVLSKSDSGLDNDMDSVSLVRSEATYQDLETPSLSRRFGSCDVLREAYNAHGELVVGSDALPHRVGSEQRFIQNRPSPALPSRHWSKRRYPHGTCRSEPSPRTVFQVGKSYQIPIKCRDGGEDDGRGPRNYYNFNSAPGHYRGNFAAHLHDDQQTYVKLPYAKPPAIKAAQSPQSTSHFAPTGWNHPPNTQHPGLRTVEERESSLEIYSSTVDRKVYSPTWNGKSYFIANRSKSASTGCLSQADSGVGQDWAEYEKSMDFDDDSQIHFTPGGSYERIADVRDPPHRETSTQTTSTTDLLNGHPCSCQAPVIKHYHNCTFIVNPKGLQVGNSSQMHYNSLPKEVQELCLGGDEAEQESGGFVEVQYAVQEIQEIPSGTIV